MFMTFLLYILNDHRTKRNNIYILLFTIDMHVHGDTKLHVETTHSNIEK